MSDVSPASAEDEAPTRHPPTTNQSGSIDLGAYNRFERIDTLIGGDQVVGDKVQGNKFEIGTLQIITYTGPAQPLDEAARFALERAYCSEVAARYAVWRTRYTTLPIQVAGRPHQTDALPHYEREELVFAALRQTFAPDKSGEQEGTDEPSAEVAIPHTFTDLRDGLARYGDLLLLGPPGGGKTTALWRLALDLAEAGLRGERATRLPIFIRLGGLKDNQSLRDLLEAELASAALEDSSGRRFPLPAHRKLVQLLPGLLDAGRLVLLWDGLNEVPQTYFTATAKALDTFRRNHPGPLSGQRTQSIVTCRADDYALLVEQCGGSDPLKVQHAIIQGLDAQTIEHLIHARLGAASGQALLDALVQPQHQALAGLARTPLLLTMLCEVYTATGALPSNRGTLLEAFVTQRWAWERPRHPDTWISEHEQERALARLAYAITASRGRGTSVAWDWAAQQLRAGIDSTDPVRLRDLGRRADLLELLDDGRAVRFSHQLVQEYFAAVALRTRIAAAVQHSQGWLTSWYGASQLRQYARPGKRTGWEETLLLLVGFEDESGAARELMRVFLSQPLQAARLLLAGGEGTDPALQEEVRQALSVALADTRLSVRQHVEAGRLLGQLGDPRPGVCTLEPAWCQVPAGSFLFGSTNQDEGAQNTEKPQRRVRLPGFRISRYPITNAQWQYFITAGGYNERRWWSQAGWRAKRKGGWLQPRWWDDPRSNGVNQPTVGISWHEATAFCQWLSAELGYKVRLPIDVQWEKAARGTDGRIYPWGNTWDVAKANSDESGIDTSTPVGSFLNGASQYGVLDMCGNVWEWTATRWMDDYQQNNRTDGGHKGREELIGRGEQWGPDNFVIRGGAWSSSRENVRCACQNRSGLSYRYRDLGFRVVAALTFDE